MPSDVKPVLLAFSGPGTSPDSVAQKLRASAVPFVEIDTKVGGAKHDLSDSKVVDDLVQHMSQISFGVHDNHFYLNT